MTRRLTLAAAMALAMAGAAAAAAATKATKATKATPHPSLVADAGSPATFDCGVAGAAGLSLLPASLVGDGVCDCCNGTDEAPGVCPAIASADGDGGSSGCDAEAAAARASLATLAAAHDAGATTAAKQHVLKSEPASRLSKELAGAAHAAAGQAQALQARLQQEAGRLQALAAQRGGGLSPASVAAFQQLQASAAAAGARAAALQAQAAADYGPGRRYLALLGDPSCAVSPVLSEKVTKGGSTTSTPKRYVYVVCGYRNVSQLEVDPDWWVRGEAAAKGEAVDGDDDQLSEVAVDAATGRAQRKQPVKRQPKPRRRVVGDPFTIGTFRGYLPLAAVDAHIAAGLVDNPAAIYGAASRAPTAPEVGTALPPLVPALPPASGGSSAAVASTPERDLSAVVAFYAGPDTCRSGDMAIPRRTYVFHACPGVTPGAMVAARRAVAAGGGGGGGGWAAAPLPARSFPAGPDWNAADEAAHAAASNVTAAALAAVLRGGGGISSSGAAPPPSALARVVHVEEDGMCTYRLWVATPLACSRQRGRDVAAALARLYPSASGGGASGG
jgi:hypothetical protein